MSGDLLVVGKLEFCYSALTKSGGFVLNLLFSVVSEPEGEIYGQKVSNLEMIVYLDDRSGDS